MYSCPCALTGVSDAHEVRLQAHAHGLLFYGEHAYMTGFQVSMAIVGCAIILFGIGIGRLERLPFQPKPKDPVIKDSQGEPYPIRPPDAARA